MAIGDIYLSSNGSPALSNSKVFGEDEISRIYFPMNFTRPDCDIKLCTNSKTICTMGPIVQKRPVLFLFLFKFRYKISFTFFQNYIKT